MHVVLRQIQHVSRALHDVVRADRSEFVRPPVGRLTPIDGRVTVRRVAPWKQVHGAGFFGVRQYEAPRAPHLCDEVARGVPVRLGTDDTRVAAFADNTAGPARVREVLFTCVEIKLRRVRPESSRRPPRQRTQNTG